MIEVTVGDPDMFVRVARALKTEAPELRKAMFKELRGIAKEALDAQRAAVLSVSSKGTSAGSAASTARAAAAMGMGPHTQARWGRAMRRSSGLRQAVARSLRIVVKDSGYAGQVGVRVTSESGRMPADQKKLPRAMDRGQWRHPVFGGPGWAGQTVTPPQWFTKVATQTVGTARGRAQAVVQSFADQLAARAQAAA